VRVYNKSAVVLPSRDWCPGTEKTYTDFPCNLHRISTTVKYNILLPIVLPIVKYRNSCSFPRCRFFLERTAGVVFDLRIESTTERRIPRTAISASAYGHVRYRHELFRVWRAVEGGKKGRQYTSLESRPTGAVWSFLRALYRVSRSLI